MLIIPDRYRRILYTLFEMGAGLLSVSFPNYPEASHSRRINLPFPPLSYHEEILCSKADEGVKG
ncbi:MAG: hypothetical protein GQ470_05450 [Gammaproteobacteria bacterium]|nr:hypothetical protein [Gammaproteobacteria bacterium]